MSIFLKIDLCIENYNFNNGEMFKVSLIIIVFRITTMTKTV